MSIKVAFSRYRDEVEGPTIGPFRDGLQITYTQLRDCTTGDDIALLGEDGDWHIVPGLDPSHTPEPWSDVHIFEVTN